MDPDMVRFHLEGLNHFVTANGLLEAFAPPISTYQKPGFVFKDIDFQSYFGGAFGTSGRLHEWPDELKQQVRKHVDAYKKIRRFLSGDYYLLIPQSRDLDNWQAWQFHDPKTDEGFVQAFRIRDGAPKGKIVLRALSREAAYQFTDIYTGENSKVTGNQATSEGLRFELPPLSSKVLMYQKVGVKFGGSLRGR
jgi:hypothetical protein